MVGMRMGYYQDAWNAQAPPPNRSCVCVSLSQMIERAHNHRDTTSGSIGLVSRETLGHKVLKKVPLPYQK